MDLTTIQIASLCQVSERTVQRWIKDKKLNAQALPNGRYRVSEDDIDAVRPPDVVTLVERIEALENDVRALREALQRLVEQENAEKPLFGAFQGSINRLIERIEALEHKQASQPKVLKPAPAQYSASSSDLVTARSFAERHKFNRKHLARLIDAGAFETTPVPHGESVLHKLNPGQQRTVLAYWQEHHIPFWPCTVEACPCHEPARE